MPAAPCKVTAVVLVVPPIVTVVAVPVPRLSPPVMESNSGLVKLVLALPVPLIRKLPVWSLLFWFNIELPSTPAKVQAEPFHINVAVLPVERIELIRVKLAVPTLPT